MSTDDEAAVAQQLQEVSALSLRMCCAPPVTATPARDGEKPSFFVLFPRSGNDEGSTNQKEKSDSQVILDVLPKGHRTSVGILPFSEEHGQAEQAEQNSEYLF